MKRFVSMLSIVLLIATMLCGCGSDKTSSEITDTTKQHVTNMEASKSDVEPTAEPTPTPTPKIPTAEELVNKQSSEGAECGDMDMKLVMDMGISVEENGTTMSMDMSMNADIGMRFDVDTMYMDGTMTVNFFGMNMEVPMKQYTQKTEEGNYVYEYDSESDTWSVSVQDEEEAEEMVGDFSELLASDVFTDLVLDTESSETEYIVTGKLNYSNFSDKTGMDMSSMMPTDGVDYSQMKMDVVMKFSKSDETIKSMKFTVDPSIFTQTEGMEDAEIREFYIEITFNVVGGNIEVEVPKEVLDTATEDTWGSVDWETEEYEEVELPELGSVAATVTDGFDSFKFNGSDITFYKTTFKEFIGNDWKIDEFWCDYNMEWVVNPEQTLTVDIESDKYGTNGFTRVNVCNNTDKAITIGDCVITSISFPYDEEGAKIDLAGGVTWGMSYADIEALYGSAEDVYSWGYSDEDNSFIYSWAYPYGDGYLHYDLEVSDKYGLTSIEIDFWY